MDEQIPPEQPMPLPPANPMPQVHQPFVEPVHHRWIKRVVIAATILAIALIGVVVWMLFGNSGKSLGVNIIIPERLQTGVPVELAVAMNNDSGSELKDAQVSVTLPAGLIFVGVPGERTVENHRIGALAANKLTKETFTIMAVGIENTVSQIKADVSYVPGALSSRFAKSVTKDAVIGEPGIELSIAPPAKSFGGEQFDTEVTYRNNSTVTFEQAQVKLQYPTGFTFVSSTQPASDSANSVWQLGSLPPGGEGKFSIKGFIIGQDNANFELKATLASSIGEVSYDIAQQTATLSMAPSPLSIKIIVGDKDDAVFGTSSGLHYRIQYANNTNVGLRDVIVTAKLVGEMFDLKTLKTDGVLRASDNTIVWNASRVPVFANLPPSASGFVDFDIQLKPAFPITRLSSKNYSITVQGQIESPTVPKNVAAAKTLGVAQVTNKLRGALNVATKGYYRDATAGIINKGDMPPKVGAATQFTLHWVLKNTSTDVEGVRVHAFLGPNVRYTGVFKTNVGSTTPEYNDRTQEIAWSIPNITATRGILSDPLDMTFQVELTPAIDQLHTTPSLIGETGVSYKDLFTGEMLAGKANTLSTQLPDDLTIFNIAKSVTQ